MFLIDKRYKRFLMLTLSGLLTGVAMVTPEIGVLGWISLVPAFLVLLEYGKDRSVRYIEIFFYGASFFLPYFLVNLQWFLFMYPLSFIDGMTDVIALAIVLLAWLGLSLCYCAAGGLVCLLIAFMQRAFPLRKFPLLTPIAAGAAWVFAEFVMTLDWWGMPTVRLASSGAGLPVGLQTASLFGSYFITFAIVVANGYLAYVLLGIFGKGRRAFEVRIAAAVFCAVLFFQYGVGGIIYATKSLDTDGGTVKVAAVQANVSSTEQWGGNSLSETKRIYREMTHQAADEGADIVLWSETALPYTLYEGGNISDYISELAKEAGVTVLAGVFTADDDGNQYNSVVCFTPDGEMLDTVYSKRHMVPFGEFVPMKVLIEALFPPLAGLITVGSDISAGDSASVMTFDDVSVGIAVCYDAVYEDVTLDAVRNGAELICVSSNDSWFGDSVYLRIHNAQIQLRAVECGRYAVHSANTGSSAVIDDRGELISVLDPLTEGIVCEEVVLCGKNTLYSYLGNSFVYLCVCTFAVLTAISVGDKVKKKASVRMDNGV